MTASEIAGLIGTLLDLDDVSVDDSFFEVGGNSLLALKLIAELEEQCGVTISLISVVRAPTPRELASLIARAPNTKGGDERVQRK